MQTLQIEKTNAIAAFNKAEGNTKEVLKTLFGRDVFGKITERVNDFNDIIVIAGRNKEEFEQMPGESEDECAYRKIKLIAEVYNEGTVLDATNTEQYKYYPWFKVTKLPSGFGLSYDGYDRWDSLSNVGVRLCFKSAELAIDAGKKFTDIYASLLIK
jgi:hypothetical protein